MRINKYISELLSQLSVSLIYFLAAEVTLHFATIEGNASLLWPPSGFALAILIRYGAKYAIGVFLGAFVTGLHVGDPIINIAIISLGNTLKPLFALFVLKHLPFSATLYRLCDYMSLLVAGSLGAVISAILGVGSRVMTDTIPISDFFHIAGRWWMGDVLGIILLTPFLLMLSLGSKKKVSENKIIESLLLITLSTAIAISIFTNWNSQSFVALGGGYLLIIPLAWSALRFSQLMTSVVIFEYFCIAIWGLIHQQGMFVDSLMMPNLTLLWANFVAITLVAHIVAYSVNDRKILTQAINSSKTEIYVFCQGDMHFEFVNQAALNNLGVSLSKALKMTPWDLKPMYSSQQFNDLMTPLINKEIDSLNFETVYQRLDGTVYPVEITIQSAQHANRVCYLASVVDITERTGREQQRILGNYVCDLSPQAIVITDTENKIIRVNPTFTDITGYSATEVIGLTPNVLNSGRHDNAFFKKLWQALSHQGQWEGELYNRRKSGELYLQHATIKVLHDAKGEAQNYIAMFNDITQEREATLQLQQLSEHDVLTALPNRLKLQQEFYFALSAAKRHDKKLAILYFDLNNFKPINDDYGHMYGDKVLQIIADRMKACIRDTDMVARIGGDEFVVLMTDIDTDNATQTLINKLKTVIAEPIQFNDSTFTVSSSSGMAKYPDHGNELKVLLNVADVNMYKDKIQMKQNLY